MIRSCTPDELIFILGQMEYKPSPGVNSVCSVADSGVLLAAALFDNWTHTAVTAHIWANKPQGLFSKEFLEAIFSYPFIMCNKKVIVTTTPSNAKDSLAVSRAFGFRETYRIKDGWNDGIDMVIKEMRREDCRYIQKEAA